MKNNIKNNLVVMFLCLSTAIFAQTDSSEVKEDIILDLGNVEVIIKEKTNESVGGDSLSKGAEELSMNISDFVKKALKDDEEEDDEPKFIETSWHNFHLGFNNLINSNDKLEPDASYGNMSLSAGNSINLQWDIVSQAMNLYKENIRLVYGIGIDFNNYRFKENIDLSTDSIPLQSAINSTNYKKNKLVTKYLNVPLMLNFKIAPRKDKEEYLYVSAGANFGYLIGSHQKQVWDDGGKKKNKIKGDFNLEQFRMGYEVQFGYKNIVLFGKYFPNSAFKDNQGPNARTVSAGILIGKV